MSEIRSPWYIGAVRAAHAPAVIFLAVETNRYGSRIRRLAARLPGGDLIVVGVDADGAPANVRPLGKPDFWREIVTVAEATGAAVVGHRLAALADEILDTMPPAHQHRWRSTVRADIHEAAALLSDRDPSALGGRGGLGLRDLAARVGEIVPDEGQVPVLVGLRASERVWTELLAPRLRPRFPLASAADEPPAAVPTGPIVCADVRIPVAFAARAAKSTEAMVRRAVRMGLPAPVLTCSDERIELIEFDTGISGHVMTTRALLTLPEAPTVGRWRFVARIDNPGGMFAENLLARVPGTSDPIPETYRHADSTACDHCGTRRARRDTFLVTDGAEWHQVGRDCLRDFLSFDPGAILLFLEALGRIIPEEKEIRAWAHGPTLVPLLHPMREIIEAAARVATVDGWVSRDTARRAAEEEGRHLVPTSEAVDRLVWGSAGMTADERLADTRFVASPAADRLRDETFLALDALDSRAGLADWERSLVTLWGAGYVDRRHLPLAVSAVVLGRRRIADDAAAPATPVAPSSFVGELGERLRGLVAEVVYERVTDSDFGLRRYVLSRRPDGVLLEWWMGTSPEIAKPATLRFDGTVKTHRWLDRSGEPVTTLNRVTIAEVLAPAPDLAA